MQAIESSGVYTLRCFGASVRSGFSGREYTQAKYPQFIKNLGSDPARLVTVTQVHGTDVLCAESANGWDSLQKADALITATPGIALGIRTADCLPVFFWSPESRVIALAHAGWRGTHKNILRIVVELLNSQFSVAPSKIKVAFGPCIRKCCYEVGDEFKEYFPGFYEIRSNGKLHMDLPGAALAQLADSGIRQSHIFDTSICTACSTDRFFSARREKTDERILSVMEIF